MRTEHNVADALREAADAVAGNGMNAAGGIRDINGNTVGSWEFTQD